MHIFSTQSFWQMTELKSPLYVSHSSAHKLQPPTRRNTLTIPQLSSLKSYGFDPIKSSAKIFKINPSLSPTISNNSQQWCDVPTHWKAEERDGKTKEKHQWVDFWLVVVTSAAHTGASLNEKWELAEKPLIPFQIHLQSCHIGAALLSIFRGYLSVLSRLEFVANRKGSK